MLKFYNRKIFPSNLGFKKKMNQRKSKKGKKIHRHIRINCFGEKTDLTREFQDNRASHV